MNEGLPAAVRYLSVSFTLQITYQVMDNWFNLIEANDSIVFLRKPYTLDKRGCNLKIKFRHPDNYLHS